MYENCMCILFTYIYIPIYIYVYRYMYIGDVKHAKDRVNGLYILDYIYVKFPPILACVVCKNVILEWVTSGLGPLGVSLAPGGGRCKFKQHISELHPDEGC